MMNIIGNGNVTVIVIVAKSLDTDQAARTLAARR